MSGNSAPSIPPTRASLSSLRALALSAPGARHSLAPPSASVHVRATWCAVDGEQSLRGNTHAHTTDPPPHTPLTWNKRPWGEITVLSLSYAERNMVALVCVCVARVFFSVREDSETSTESDEERGETKTTRPSPLCPHTLFPIHTKRSPPHNAPV